MWWVNLPAVALATPEAVLAGIALTTVKSGCIVGVAFDSGAALVVARVKPRARSKMVGCIVIDFVDLVSIRLQLLMEICVLRYRLVRAGGLQIDEKTMGDGVL